MYTELNDDDSIKKRLYGNRLVSSGRALIILGVWSAIKSVIVLYMTMPYIIEYVNERKSYNELDFKEMSIFVWAVSIIIMVAVFLIHFFVGRSAMKNGYGKKNTVLFLVFDSILVITIVFSIIVGIGEKLDVMDFASILIDLTVVFACVDILYSAIRLKSIDKKIREKE